MFGKVSLLDLPHYSAAMYHSNHSAEEKDRSLCEQNFLKITLEFTFFFFVVYLFFLYFGEKLSNIIEKLHVLETIMDCKYYEQNVSVMCL